MTSVFIVDDDMSLHTIFRLILERAGFTEFIFASNGKEAVEKFRELNPSPDIIIMDHRMPLMSGIDALGEILDFNRNARVIFVSADEAVKEQTIALGAREFIKKPFDIRQLLIAIEKVMNLEKKI